MSLSLATLGSMADETGEGVHPSEEATQRARSRLTKLDDGQIQHLSATLRHFIDHAAQRIEYAEHRRGAFATLAGGLIAASIALLAIIADANASPVRAALVALSIGFLSTAVVVLVAWSRQTNPPYGFIRTEAKSDRPWKWFYRDALTNSDLFKFEWWHKRDHQTNKSGGTEFPRQWPDYVERHLGLADIREDILQDLRQSYLLHVNERYKNLFLTQVKRLLVIGISASIILSVLTLAWAVAVDDSPNNSDRSTVREQIHQSPSPAASRTRHPRKRK